MDAMKTLTTEKFLAWAATKGLVLDPRYPHSAVLSFRRDERLARFWNVPANPTPRPYFALSFLELMGDWSVCHVWRHLGGWSAPAPQFDSRKINHLVETRILGGLGMPLGSSSVVTFDRSELPSLVTLLFSTTLFGWSTWEDLYVVPDHARQLLQTDHHNVFHIEFRNDSDVEPWVAGMRERGFALPEELPDATFKRPSWMRTSE
jgi:hypothetical protein